MNAVKVIYCAFGWLKPLFETSNPGLKNQCALFVSNLGLRCSNLGLKTKRRFKYLMCIWQLKPLFETSNPDLKN